MWERNNFRYKKHTIQKSKQESIRKNKENLTERPKSPEKWIELPLLKSFSHQFECFRQEIQLQVDLYLVLNKICTVKCEKEPNLSTLLKFHAVETGFWEPLFVQSEVGRSNTNKPKKGSLSKKRCPEMDVLVQINRLRHQSQNDSSELLLARRRVEIYTNGIDTTSSLTSIKDKLTVLDEEEDTVVIVPQSKLYDDSEEDDDVLKAGSKETVMLITEIIEDEYLFKWTLRSVVSNTSKGPICQVKAVGYRLERDRVTKARLSPGSSSNHKHLHLPQFSQAFGRYFELKTKTYNRVIAQSYKAHKLDRSAVAQDPVVRYLLFQLLLRILFLVVCFSLVYRVMDELETLMRLQHQLLAELHQFLMHKPITKTSHVKNKI